ncbi:uncharacterized protein LOC131608002 [Vicia villosa]|uniref:uncharacterized protein LOC131608002 n=1 Tax=Vicia villosa TaxID=3911 RepID=UPI00273B69D8|nr:uncharacterized protein LOC131608002 [Vicia villosa]
MGNGTSRVNSTPEQGESIPAKVRSTIVGRFEDFRKQRNAESTLSKKKLLKNGEEEDGGSSVSRSSSNETNETKDGKVSVSTKEETTVPLTTTENISRVVPVEDIECKTIEEKVNIKNEIHVSKDKEIHANVKDEEENKIKEERIKRLVEEVEKEQEQEASAKCEKSDDNDHEEDDDDEESDLGRFLCPGSPSFKIYCIEADERKTQEEEKDKEEEEKFKNPTLQKSRSDNCLESSSSKNTRISNEVSQIVEDVPSTKRKGHMMRRFGAVRTLLKVKSCYHPICTCTGDDRRSNLVSAKATN